MALALVHHLRITYNVPLSYIRDYFSKIGKYLIIEFVEKTDSQVRKMLLNREDIFDDFSIDNFESVFCEKYNIVDKMQIKNSNRSLYLMELKR